MTSTCSRVAALALTGVVLSGQAFASNYEFSFQAAKAAALGGAFIAQADDPSAVFYNPGAMALLEEKPEVTAGLSLLSTGQSLFQGLSPGVAAGFNGEQKTTETPMPHAYMVKKVSPRISVGGGVYSPFLILTDWANQDTFPGRTIALSTELTTYDAAGGAAFKLMEGLGFGVNFIYRASDFSLTKRFQALNPGSGTIEDIADFSIETPFDTGYGWSAGAVYRFLEKFSVGATYRSAIDINYSGTGTLTQIETGDELFDQLIRAANPFDQDLGMGTSFSFPDQLGLGVAYDLSQQIKLEVDFNQTGWSDFSSLVLFFPGRPLLSDVVPANFVDTTTLRGAARLRRKSGAEYRASIVFAETPVPSETVGPLFPDADSTSVGFGYGKDWLDVAFVWTEFAARNSRRSELDFNGNYASNAWVFSLSVSK